MSNKLIVLAVLIVVILAGGLYLNNKSGNVYNANNTPTPKSSVSTNETSQISPSGVSIVINEQNASGESGIATVSEVEGKVVVNLKLIGASAQTPQPANLHSGTCEAPGDVVYPLTNVVSGQSKTTLDVDMAAFNSKLPLILNVHKSKDEISVYTSCGKVTPQ